MVYTSAPPLIVMGLEQPCQVGLFDVLDADGGGELSVQEPFGCKGVQFRAFRVIESGFGDYKAWGLQGLGFIAMAMLV